MKVRLLRGQVVVRETTPPASQTLWMPEEKARQVKTHRGVVLGMGPPALFGKFGVEVPYDFQVGDEVSYHFVHHAEAHTRPWPLDGLDATWVPQHAVDAVWERDD